MSRDSRLNVTIIGRRRSRRDANDMEEKVDFAQYVNIARMDLDEIQQVIFLSLSASCQKEKWPPSITPQKKGGEIPLKKKFLLKWNAEEEG